MPRSEPRQVLLGRIPPRNDRRIIALLEQLLDGDRQDGIVLQIAPPVERGIARGRGDAVVPLRRAFGVERQRCPGRRVEIAEEIVERAVLQHEHHDVVDLRHRRLRHSVPVLSRQVQCHGSVSRPVSFQASTFRREPRRSSCRTAHIPRAMTFRTGSTPRCPDRREVQARSDATRAIAAFWCSMRRRQFARTA